VLTGTPFLLLADGSWPIFNVSCPRIGERGCPSFAGFAKLGTTDPGLAGGWPIFRFLACTSAKEAAPALPVLQSWAPRTPASPVVSRDLPDL
jgi:hypothetical protein